MLLKRCALLLVVATAAAVRLPGATAATANEAILFLPCFDSDSAFQILRPRQQFRWGDRAGQVELLSRRGSCVTAAAAVGSEGPLQLSDCLPRLQASQNWSTAPDSDKELTTPWGFTVCGGVPVPSKQAYDAPVQRNYQGWITSPERHNSSSPGGSCLNYDPQASVFRSETLEGEQQLCLSHGPGIRPCDPPSPAAGLPLCNTSLSVSERVSDLVQRIPSAAKPYQLVMKAPAINSLWIPGQNYWNEALHGLLSGGAVCPTDQNKQRTPTEFPSAISSAASFNKSLFWEIGSAVGTEARVESNKGTSRGWTFWTPNVNIFRDPRWGRGQETPGEDPVVNGMYGAMFVSGFQGDDTAPLNGSAPEPPLQRLKSSACAKHFFGYSLENCFNARDNCRFNFNANLSQQEIEDTYLPAFQSTVEVGRVTGLMCSENAVNGQPTCANQWALNTVARTSWGFSGYVTGDCGAIDAIFSPYPTSHNFSTDTAPGHNGHGYTMPPNTSVNSAGLDLDCTSANRSRALGTAADTDTALQHVWAVQFRLGRFDPLSASIHNTLGWESMGTRKHQQLALQAAREGIVLLKNADSTLPLSSRELNSKPNGVVLIGPTAEIRSGGYSGRGTGGPLTAPTATCIARYANTTVVPGCSNVSCTDGSGIAAAVAAAAEAEVVMVAIGISSDGDPTDRFEGENGDRRALLGDIRLPGHQEELVSKVAAAAKKPIILMVTGSSVDISNLKSNNKVGAIIWRGYSGEASGLATADVLFGIYNPSGRLTTTWYQQSFVTSWKPGIDPYTGGPNPSHNASYFDHHTRPNSTTGNPGRGYRFFTGDPVYRFGYGLSYSTFEHELISAAMVSTSVEQVQIYAAAASELHNFRRDSKLARVVHTAEIAVTNSGPRAGSTSVLAYAVPPTAGVDGAPLRSLIDFQKIWLEGGETKTVAISVTAHDLTLTKFEGGREGVVGLWTIEVGNTESWLSVE